jgi:hypothetical protein
MFVSPFPPMTQPSLQDFFGTNATQDLTTITIQKSDLPFTATANNNGEQVVAAVIKKIQGNATKTNFDADGDRNIFIDPGFTGIQSRTIGNNQETLIDTPLTVHFAQIATTTGIEPDNY